MNWIAHCIELHCIECGWPTTFKETRSNLFATFLNFNLTTTTTPTIASFALVQLPPARA